MGHMNYYNKIGKNSYGTRGFKLNMKKFSVQSIRAKFVFMFDKFFSKRWRLFSYGGLLRSMRRKRSKEKCGSRGNLDMKDFQYRNIKNDYGLRSYGRSNSFCSEAIADCLEFIKRNSISSLDENPVLER